MSENAVSACRIAVQQYLETASPSPDENLGTTMSLVWQHGGDVVPIGFALIVGELRALSARELPRAQVNLVARKQLSEKAVLFLYSRLNAMHDLVSACSYEAVNNLMTTLQMVKDEDIRALVAFTIGSQQFAHPVLQPTLASAHSTTVGTSARLAIAFAQYMCGDRANLKSYVDGGYFMDVATLRYYEQVVNQRPVPNSTVADREHALVMMAVVPEMVGMVLPGEVPQRGLVSMLAVDIVTNGQAFQNYPVSWRRWQR